MIAASTFSPRLHSTGRLRQTVGVLLAAAACFIPAPVVRAEVEFDGLFSRGGVLQRGVKVPIFGTGDDGDEVTVTFQGKSASTTVKGGKWRVELGPYEAGGPYSLTLAGTSESLVRNVYVGDVWVCAGESNMQSPVQSAEGYAAAIGAGRKNRELHFYTVKRAGADKPPASNTGKWSEGAGSATVGVFSAVGYYFGRDIAEATDVPIGLIACNHFSSTAEAWTSRESILAEPTLKSLIEDAPPAYYTHTPGKLYTGMVLPLADYAVRGVIFYQGESNVERADKYRTLFTLLIADWRKAWNRPDLPFLFVQLNGYKPASSKSGEGRPAEIRDAQLEVWKATPGTAMVVSTDFSDPYNQIPKAKEPIGKRLAFAARVVAYGEKFEYSGPVLREATISGDVARLTFDHMGEGLLAKDGKLTGFALAGADGEFLPAEAEVVGNEVIVKSEAVKEPKRVRYNWADFPTGNLFNKDGFPASPFGATLTEPKAPVEMKTPPATVTSPAPVTPGSTPKEPADGKERVLEYEPKFGGTDRDQLSKYLVKGSKEIAKFDGKTFRLTVAVPNQGAGLKGYLLENETPDQLTEWVVYQHFPRHEDPKFNDIKLRAEQYAEGLGRELTSATIKIVEDEATKDVLLDFAARTSNSKFVGYNLMKFARAPDGGVLRYEYVIYERENLDAFVKNLKPLRDRLRKLMLEDGVSIAK